MRYWFTADTHYGHANIIKYCNRPFDNVDEMNETLIKKHNERVKDEDTVFFIGDFCFKNSIGGKKGEGMLHKPKHYLDQLNGNFLFIKGNHDKNNSLKTIIERMVIRHAGYRVNLVHNPEFVNVNYDLNLVGHVHNAWKFKRAKHGFTFTDVINVGVDVWDFRPVTFEEVMKGWNEWKKFYGHNKPQAVGESKDEGQEGQTQSPQQI